MYNLRKESFLSLVDNLDEQLHNQYDCLRLCVDKLNALAILFYLYSINADYSWDWKNRGFTANNLYEVIKKIDDDTIKDYFIELADYGKKVFRSDDDIIIPYPHIAFKPEDLKLYKACLANLLNKNIGGLPSGDAKALALAILHVKEEESLLVTGVKCVSDILNVVRFNTSKIYFEGNSKLINVQTKLYLKALDYKESEIYDGSEVDRVFAIANPHDVLETIEDTLFSLNENGKAVVLAPLASLSENKSYLDKLTQQNNLLGTINIPNKNKALIVLDANRTASKCVANFSLNEKLDLKTLRNITAALRNFN